ncbi:MAG: hypothetical protein ACFB21_06955 [Opitutales bacterium]
MADANFDIQIRAKAALEGLEKTQRELKASEQAAGRFKSVLQGIGAGIGIQITQQLAQIPGAMIQATRSAIAFGDSIDKVAGRVGSTTDFLQEFRFAAGQTGVEARTADMALQRFSRRFAEAADGGGELLAILDENNIALRDSDGRVRSLEDALGDYADLIAGTADPQERLRLSFKAFDSEGAALVNTLLNGRAGLQAFQEEARDLGAVLDSEAITKLVAAQDALGRVEQRLQVATAEAIVDTGLADKLIDGIGDLSAFLKDPQVLDNIEYIGQVFLAIAEAAGRTFTGWQRIGNYYGAMAAYIADGFGATGLSQDMDFNEYIARYGGGVGGSGSALAMPERPDPVPTRTITGQGRPFDSSALSQQAALELEILNLRTMRQVTGQATVDGYEAERKALVGLRRLEADRAVSGEADYLQQQERIAQLDVEIEKVRELQETLRETSSFGGEVQAGLTAWTQSYGSLARQTAGTITGTLGTAVDSLSSGFAQLASGAITFQQFWTQALLAVYTEMVRLIAQMIIMATLRAVLAPFTGGFSLFGFKDGVVGMGVRNLAGGEVGLSGPGTTTSDSIPARLSVGESVITAAGTQRNAPFLRFANAGGRIADLMPGGAAAGAMPGGGSGGVDGMQVDLVQVHTEAQFRQWVQSPGGRKIIMDVVSGKRTQLGIR